MTRLLLTLTLAVVLAAPVPGRSAADESPWDLATRGVEIAPGTWAELPAAILRLDVDQGPADLRELAGPADWDRFTAAGLAAPVTVIIEPFPAAGERLGHRVRSAFCLRTTLGELEADEALERSLGVEERQPQDEGVAEGSKARPLTADELREAGIPADATGGERLAYLEMPLLNRVVVRGVVRVEKRDHPTGVELVWQFDPRFREHPRLAASWTRLEENELGQRVEGPRHPYHGCGGIVTVRHLAAEADGGLLVVESRLVIGEPEAWFHGANLLRSKIPLATQEGVRTLRRRLAAAR